MKNQNVNIIFAGNFIYPHGMAEAKRIQNSIDSLKGTSYKASVLLFRQAHAGRDDNYLSGDHDGTPYRTIGRDVALNWKLPFTLIKYLMSGLAYITNRRRPFQRDIIYVYMEPNIESVLFLLYAKLIGYKLVIDITEDHYFLSKDAHIFSWIKAKTSEFFMRHIDFFTKEIIVISTHLKNKFDHMYDGRISVSLLPISVNLGNFSKKSSDSRKPLKMLYAGSFAEKDAVENLIDAFNVACETHHNIELILTGKGVDESRMEAILDRARSSPFSGKITYAGYLDDSDFYQVLRDCDIPCMVRTDSFYSNAGFPFKLGEYLATGQPVIASNVGDVNVYLENMRSVMLVGAGSVNEIVEAIDFLVSHPDKAAQIGENGRRVAQKYFSTEVVGSKLLNILARL